MPLEKRKLTKTELIVIGAFLNPKYVQNIRSARGIAKELKFKVSLVIQVCHGLTSLKILIEDIDHSAWRLNTANFIAYQLATTNYAEN